MDVSDRYKFLGKYENFEQLDKYTFQQGETEYLRKLNDIWSSPLSVPRKTCSLCRQAEETVAHLLSSCAALAQTHYKARHDRILRPVYHLIREKFAFEESNSGVP